MNKTVVIQSVEQAKTKKGKVMYKVKVDADGQSLFFNVFNDKEGHALAKAAETEQEVVLDLEESGEWLNLNKIVTEIKDAEGVVVPSAKPKPAYTGGAKADPKKISSIERQSALKQAVEFHSPETKLEDILETADKMLEWLTK